MKKSQAIFAIYPNALGFGYACLETPRVLIDYGIVKINPICNNKILKRAINFIDYYEPTLLLLQDYNSESSRHAKRVDKVINSIVSYAKGKSIPFKHYSKEQIRFVFEQFGAKTKYEIAKTILRWLPELNYRAPKVRKLWMSEDYNMGIFDALSVALTHYYLTD